MKKLLAVMLVTVLAVAAFAGITATGPTLTTAIGGSATFGLIFDETGLDLYLSNGITYNAYWGFDVSIEAVASDNATLTLALGGSMQTQDDSSDVVASFYSATYEDSLLIADFVNDSYGDTLNKYFLGNELDADGNPVTPLGTRYLTVNLKDLDADLLYITLDNKLSMHSTETGEMLWADVFGAKKSLDVSVGTLAVSAAMWAADPETRATVDGTGIGYAAGLEFAGADALEGLTVNGAFGMMDKSGMGFDASYEKDVVLTSAPTMTVTPHVSMEYRTGIANLPLAHQTYTADASSANGGVDFNVELGNTTLNVYDTVTYSMAKDSKMTYVYGLSLADTTVDLANISATIEKSDNTEVATPFVFTAKVNGSTEIDSLSFDYFVEVMDLGNAKISIDKLSDLTKKYMAYEANVSYTMDKVEFTGSVYNYTKDADGLYDVISEISKPVYELGVNYKPNSIITLGGHLGTEGDGTEEHEPNWGDFAAIHWYLSALATYEF